VSKEHQEQGEKAIFQGALKMVVEGDPFPAE